MKPHLKTLALCALLGSLTGVHADTTVYVDPANSWSGYMNVFELPANGGGYVFGSPWGTVDLRAVFSGSGLTLSPNTIGDPNPFWYIGGGAPGNPGNKSMDANMYVETPVTPTTVGALSGQTVTFTGTVSANTLTSAHTSVAFIKDFAPDYGSSNVITAPLVNGVFNISLATDPGEGRHVQYGFQTIGVNVWATDVGPFGSVLVNSDITNSYATWIARFDFSSFTAPDLTAAGDPDGDGQNNITEFALNGDPTSGAASGKMSSSIADLSGDKALLLTLPVFNGVAFAGSPAPSATVGDLGYTIEGSNGLTLFDQAVTEVSPASTAGLPGIDSGWTYRSFRLNGAIGGVTPRGPAGFLRARIVKTP